MTIDISKLNSLYINSKKVSSLWLNGKKLKLGEEATSDALIFTALEAPFTVYLQKTGSPYTVSLVYSTDGDTWNDYNVGESITVSRVNAKVMFKAKTTNATFSSSVSSYYTFYTSSRCKVSGNIMSLLDITSDSVYDYAFYRLFYNNIRIVDASALELPATTLATYCYNSMFYGCTSLTSIEAAFTSWNTTNATSGWTTRVASEGTFICPEALGTDSTIERGNFRCPNNWLVANYDVDGAQFSNAFTRGSYTTAFLEDGSSHTPDFSSLSVYNGQTAEKLVEGTDYTITYPADTTTAGTKTCTFTGISPYTGTKDFTYLIAVKSLAACTIEVGSAYDDEGPSYVNVVQPQADYTLVKDTDYTLSWSTSGDETTVTITGINGWAGTYTTTVAHKTSGTTPVAFYKHDQTVTQPLAVKLIKRGSPDDVKLQVKVDDGQWQSMAYKTEYQATSIIKVRAVDYNSRFAKDSGNYNNFEAYIPYYYGTTGVDLSGSLESLLDRSQQITSLTATHALNSVFNYRSGLTSHKYIYDASKLTIKPMLLSAGYCFRQILKSQPGLTAAPSFTGLSVAAEKPYACIELFDNCQNVVSADLQIPWVTGPNVTSYTTIATFFRNCTGLKDAVVRSHFGDGRPWEDTYNSKSNLMNSTFDGCTSLSCISTDISSWGTPNGWDKWVNGLSSNCTFICPEALGTNETIQRGVNFCPTGWTVVNIEEKQIQYVDYVQTNSYALDTGYKPTINTSLSTCLSGDAGGNCLLGFSNDDEKDYRLFNFQKTLYFDMGGSNGGRISTSGWDTSNWTDISAWNYGFKFTPEGGSEHSASGAVHTTIDWDTNGTITIAGTAGGTGIAARDICIKYLKIYENGTLVKDFRPALDADNVAGLYEEVEGKWFYPTGGAWTAHES